PVLLMTRDNRRLLWEHKSSLLLLGIVNSSLPFSLYGWAALSLDAGFTSLLNASTPIFTAIIGFLWLRLPLGRWQIVGLLIGGIATPMLEIEAKISSLELQVLGQAVTFKDQVLYFQSKSVLDVVVLLAETGALDMIFVAFLIGLFSVVFPSAKLLAGLAYFQGRANWRESKFVRFFALYSGKWSMADVMVVAIFMAYIGFEGLVSSQLDELAGSSRSLEILTTNGTHLLPGYYLFLAFCLSGLALSTLLENRSPPRP
ncbi:MAG: EamA family transporter, partial [Pseudomonadota bacterium]